MNIVPDVNNFKVDFLRLATNTVRCSRQKNSYFYEQSLKTISSERGHSLIRKLVSYLNRRSTLFHREVDCIRFVVGLVHYCPQLLIKQLKEVSLKQRYYVVLLLRSTISNLVGGDYSLNHVFTIRTTDTSPYSYIVLRELLNRFMDCELCIRKEILITMLPMLVCSKELLDYSMRKEVFFRLVYLIGKDPSIDIRELALSSIADIAHNKPSAILFQTIGEQTFNNMLRSVIFHTDYHLRLVAQKKFARIYIDLMRYYHLDKVYQLDCIGQIAGALMTRYRHVAAQRQSNNCDPAVAEECLHLWKLLDKVKRFLHTPINNDNNCLEYT